MKQKKILFLFSMVFLISIFINKYTYAMEDEKVYIIVVNKLSLLDIQSMPNIERLIDDGTFGLMNTRGVASHRGPESFATINSSAKTYANNESSEFYNLNEEYLKTYQNRTASLEDKYSIGNIGIGRLYNQNKNNRYTPHIGALGDLLHDKGLKTAVFGNADTEETIDRTAALIVMDSKGLIDYGNLDRINHRDDSYPYGYRTDYLKILMEIEQVKHRSSLIVVETGDLTRLNRFSDFLSQENFNSKRQLILKDIDGFIGSLCKNIEKKNSLLMVISPNQEDERIGNSKLSPIILWGKNIEKGMVISSTTNRKGIVSNLDIAPTVADFLGIPHTDILGNSIEDVKTDRALDYVKSMNGSINTTAKVRTKALLFYSIISIAMSIIISLFFLLNIKIDKHIKNLFKIGLLFLYGVPLIFIFNSLFLNHNMVEFLSTTIFMAGIYGLFVFKYNGKKTMIFISVLIFIIVFVDLIFNGIITRFSVFSHDPSIGARYYGIGNELMGVFLAISTLVGGILLEKSNKKIIPIVFLIVSIFLLGYPKFGANVGATISLLGATIYFVFKVRKKQVNLKVIIMSMFITATIIMAMGYLDIKGNANPTHLANSLKLLNDKGITIAYNIISRKLSINLRLLRTSIWTKVLLSSIFAQVTVMYKKHNQFKKMIDRKIGIGISSGLVGSMIGFLFNDSGIMLAAIAMNLITIFILFFILNDEAIY